MEQSYVLFSNHTDGMELYQELKKRGIKTIIAPTPRSLSKCCGISLLIREGDIERIKLCVKECLIPVLDVVKIQNTFNHKNDHYC